MTPPAIGVRRAPARTTVARTERPTGRQSARRRLPRSGRTWPPPGRQSQILSGPLAGGRQEGASGDRGAPGPRPDGNRGYRAARWPAVGRMMPPAIGALKAPARTTAVRPRGPLAGKRRSGASGDRGAPCPRPDGSRRDRPAYWPANGEARSSGDRGLSPARTATLSAARPRAGERPIGPSGDRELSPPGRKLSSTCRLVPPRGAQE